MKVNKVINKNLVRSFDEKGNEVLIMGCGLGYKKKADDEIDMSMVEKIYRITDENTAQKLSDLLLEIPQEHVRIANLIIDYAKQTLDKELSDNIYISITDHISFALERMEKGMPLKNALLWEIKKYYHSEYSIGLESLAIIKRELGVELPEDEAGYIAIHLVEASVNVEDSSYVSETVTMIQAILSIIKFHFQINLDENSLAFDRFMVHLKFFIERVLKNQAFAEDEKLYETLKDHFNEEFKCCGKIKRYFLQQKGINIPDTELLYLAIHIKRILNNK